MKPTHWVIALALGAGFCASNSYVDADTVQTLGAGTAVTQVDRSAAFEALNYNTNGTPLSDFTEGDLYIRVDGDSWVGDGEKDFDPFHGANGSDRTFEFPYGGSYGWVTIETVDAVKIYAVEFMYGNGWTTGDIYGQYPWGNDEATVTWETWSGGTLVSTGTIGGGPLLEMGTIIGFYDGAGFDQLLLKCTIYSSGDPDLQALAMDNLYVQLSPGWVLGDMNCDGLVDFNDIDPFVTALTGQQDYEAQYPNCHYMSGDVNRDGSVDFNDIDVFVTCVINGACP